jgi:hypothetical protein
MAKDNPLWGSERIGGERLQLNIRVAKGTLQKDLRHLHRRHPSSQTGRTFLHDPAQEIGAGDCLPVLTLCFRQSLVCFILHWHSRRVVHFGVPANPTDAWTAPQLPEATPFGSGPEDRIRATDRKDAVQFGRVAAGADITVIQTPIAAPTAKAVGERFEEEVRRECLDHCFVFGRAHLYRIIKA